MSADSALIVNSDLSIPRSELTFRATRAGGPGGQHVNTSSTRVELSWNVESSRSLSEEQRARLRTTLDNRLDSQGNVRVVASAFRSQTRNRDAAEERLVALLLRALTPAKVRKRTRPSRAAKEKRLLSKRRRSETKRERRSDHDDM